MTLATTPDEGLPIATTYAAVTREWTRLVRKYAQATRLYQEALVGRHAERPTARRHKPGLPRSTSYKTVTGVRAQHVQTADVFAIDGAVPSGGVMSVDAGGREHLTRERLTRRQVQIAELIAQGLTNAQIAQRLVVSRGTVGNHIGHMLRRLGAHNRAQIAAWTIRHDASAD